MKELKVPPNKVVLLDGPHNKNIFMILKKKKVNELKVPPNKVVLLGHSIGGAIATRLAASKQGLPVCLWYVCTYVLLMCSDCDTPGG